MRSRSAKERTTQVEFRERIDTEDQGGGVESSWKYRFWEWCTFWPERGTEQLRSGRLEAALGGVLWVDASDKTRQADETWSVVIDGDPYQIRSIVNSDQRNREIEIVVERGASL